ncbi:unnamed protein product, partial [marine sediment metagenome]
WAPSILGRVQAQSGAISFPGDGHPVLLFTDARPGTPNHEVLASYVEDLANREVDFAILTTQAAAAESYRDAGWPCFHCRWKEDAPDPVCLSLLSMIFLDGLERRARPEQTRKADLPDEEAKRLAGLAAELFSSEAFRDGVLRRRITAFMYMDALVATLQPRSVVLQHYPTLHQRAVDLAAERHATPRFVLTREPRTHGLPPRMRSSISVDRTAPGTSVLSTIPTSATSGQGGLDPLLLVVSGTMRSGTTLLG